MHPPVNQNIASIRLQGIAQSVVDFLIEMFTLPSCPSNNIYALVLGIQEQGFDIGAACVLEGDLYRSKFSGAGSAPRPWAPAGWAGWTGCGSGTRLASFAAWV